MSLYEFMFIDAFGYGLDEVYEMAREAVERRNEWKTPFKNGWDHKITFMGKDDEGASKWLVEVFGEYDEEFIAKMEEAATKNAANFGTPETMIDGETGEYMMLNGQITEYGLKILKEKT